MPDTVRVRLVEELSAEQRRRLAEWAEGTQRDNAEVSCEYSPYGAKGGVVSITFDRGEWLDVATRTMNTIFKALEVPWVTYDVGAKDVTRDLWPRRRVGEGK